MGLEHQLSTDEGVQRLYSVAIEIWNPRRRVWEAKMDTCHAWNAENARHKIMASYPGRHIRVAIAGLTLGFFVNDNHGEDLEV